ncbi:hypothetical protein [Pseudomonas sp. NFACC39-1]|uniref:hypothetical protein n=1 Tax=Pseudomonas sp. NFACC39-1 TaxID=1566195 RepID=UPI0008CD821C|nr:hypothetical protein [Pseudomonas sp. NFACC39-1]SEO79730.1 hypothetical protein SAMN03159293_03962 [Pseudomonas sp. NFACC39-1]
MNRMFCTALSLSIIASSSTGCAAKPVKEPLKVPQVYGYTLNQPLSSNEFMALSATGGESGTGSKVYKRVDDQGDAYEVFLDSKIRPDVIRKTSRAFASQSECEAEFEVQVAQLKQHLARHDIATRGLGPESRTLVPGDRYVGVNATECGARQYDHPEAYRYVLSLSEDILSPAPKRGLADKVHDAYGAVGMTVFVIALLPFVLVGWAVDKASD